MFIFNKKPFLIADISINVFDFAKKEQISDFDAAILLIDEAKSSGVDAVMFQSYSAENMLSRDPSAFEDLEIVSVNSYFDSIKKYDKFGVGEFRKLAEHCHSIGMLFLSTPLDFESADYLEDFIDVYGIASSDLTNIPFIKHIASKNKPILLSTGASTLIEIKKAIGAIEEVSTVDVAIMHSVLSFPTKLEDANLLMIKDLVENFPNYEIGYSDHTESDEHMLTLTTAYNYGATILEKHFTFDKTMDSSDNSYAMDADDIIIFKRNILFLSKISGKKNKQPLICESLSKKEFRKSIVAKHNIDKGKVIEYDDITFKRPGTGLNPSEIENIVGKTAKENISEDSLINFQMLK